MYSLSFICFDVTFCLSAFPLPRRSPHPSSLFFPLSPLPLPRGTHRWVLAKDGHRHGPVDATPAAVRARVGASFQLLASVGVYSGPRDVDAGQVG